jgi:outer membrane immunogenic protein
MRIVFAAVAAACGLVLPLAAQAQSVPGTGPYIGINAGYGWGNSQQRDEVIPQLPPPPPVINNVPADGDYRVRGAALGLGLGYGFLVDKLLIGIEGDVNWSGIEGASQVCGGDHKCGTRLDGFATLRGRVGTPIAAGTLA